MGQPGPACWHSAPGSPMTTTARSAVLPALAPGRGHHIREWGRCMDSGSEMSGGWGPLTAGLLALTQVEWTPGFGRPDKPLNYCPGCSVLDGSPTANQLDLQGHRLGHWGYPLETLGLLPCIKQLQDPRCSPNSERGRGEDTGPALPPCTLGPQRHAGAGRVEPVYCGVCACMDGSDRSLGGAPRSFQPPGPPGA